MLLSVRHDSDERTGLVFSLDPEPDDDITMHKDGRLTQWCGAACLAFAAVAKTHGLKIAAHI